MFLLLRNASTLKYKVFKNVSKDFVIEKDLDIKM